MSMGWRFHNSMYYLLLSFIILASSFLFVRLSPSYTDFQVLRRGLIFLHRIKVFTTDRLAFVRIHLEVGAGSSPHKGRIVHFAE